VDLRAGRGGRDEDRKFYADLGEELCRYIGLIVRYETPDENGETRRERNARFGVESPEIEPVEGGEFLLSVFWALNGIRSQGFAGPDPIRPRDIIDWSELTGTVLHQEERSIFLRMDAAFRAAWYAEAEEARARDAERAKERQRQK